MTTQDILTDLYIKLTGRKFLTMVAIAVILLLDNIHVLTLDPATKNQLVTLALGYIVVEGGVDGVKAFQAAKSGSSI